MPPTAFVLRQPLTAQRPYRWDINGRYTFYLPGETISLSTGTWLLALPDTVDNCSPPAQYRLADGSIVTLETPLTSEQADPLNDQQALTALIAYRPLEEAVLADWGLQMEQIDSNASFHLIQCPLCEGTAFTTVGFTQVWCDGCFAQFSIRSTVGDPGFVVDCTWPHYTPSAAHYLLPRSEGLSLTTVHKDSGNPSDPRQSPHCHRNNCTETQVALVDGSEDPLRSGLHACAIGDVYDWSFHGYAPSVIDNQPRFQHELYWPDNPHAQAWPATAKVCVSGLSWNERHSLQVVASLLAQHAPSGQFRDDICAKLTVIANRPLRAPILTSRSPWPPRCQLKASEKYLLHRFLVEELENSGIWKAHPQWLVVTSLSESPHDDRWQVVRDNLCPHCGQTVTAEEMAVTGDEKELWQYPHGSCRETWQRHTWQPTLFGSEK